MSPRGSIFGTPLPSPDALRARLRAQSRAPEQACVTALLPDARLSDAEAPLAEATARRLVMALRQQKPASPLLSLMHEYDLSTTEGLMLMRLAEALLRIPDGPTADALIRDTLLSGDWRSHLGRPSMAVNAASFGLDLTARLLRHGSGGGPVARSRDTLIRQVMTHLIGRMGEIFVCGETIDSALRAAKRLEPAGFRFSFDMLGEAALTAADADRYFRDYETAIRAIGAAATGRGIHAGPGISIKLSALHPRYALAQRRRVMAELLPRLGALVEQARAADIGVSIDAEESERLDLSLDLLEALCCDPRFTGWNGIGFVVQAYQKRASFVLDWIIQLARTTGHRLMLRLVKGAYWDSEIKRAQQEGQADYPVFTRKTHTDLSYLACARKLLAAPDAVFPQFATHNAQTLAAIGAMAGSAPDDGAMEFQCLYGMGEQLYRTAFMQGLAPACRIYAPVGTHETLLAYLVRRLLENGANGSFVHRLQDPSIPVEALTREPAEEVLTKADPGAPHPGIPLPRDLYGAGRANSRGLDLADVTTLSALDAAFQAMRLPPMPDAEATVTIRNPADHADILGRVHFMTPAAVSATVARAQAAADAWAARPTATRSALLRTAADHFETALPQLLPLIIREAGKTLGNAVGEVREAVDFLRYYAARAEAPETAGHRLGPVACISPWNFPLAIFTGQVAAALVTGNAVLAKPAEETPLTAAAVVALLHEAGIPPDVLQLVPGAGDVGAALVADPRIRGVVFTGSGAVAKQIERTLAKRLNPDGRPVPLIAETGGLNAMVVDSSALPEQVVADVIASAFDSAGQRCSALRLLCLQKDVADQLLPMLRGAMAELAVGDPWQLATDIGPVISAAAQEDIEAYVAQMRAAGFVVERATKGPTCGTFVSPTLIRISQVADLRREVFGPVLHVMTYEEPQRDALVAAINATGFALTAGVQSRVDRRVEEMVAALAAGNVYVNRNIIGATVGVQPFGGHGLSGTGPKAGGPLYLRRFLAVAPPLALPPTQRLPGPAGEENRYLLQPRRRLLCAAPDDAGHEAQRASARAHGVAVTLSEDDGFDAVLFTGDAARLAALLDRLAARDGAIRPVFVADSEGRYPLEAFVMERAVSINTAAAGGSVELLRQA
ncbi:bifunctional proline dehydrogenase/L-glutamate gamma-semialdehyde dehydrogenase PutA [Acidisoma sp. 7E03]